MRVVETTLRRHLLVAGALLLASCAAADSPASDDVAPLAVDSPASAEAAPPAPEAPAPLTPDGWGPLRIGMTRAEVVAAAGEDARPEAVGGPDPEQCDEFRPARAPDGMLVMIEQGLLTRISIARSSTVKTERGFGVGDPAAAIKAAYGDEADVSPHKYSPAPAEYVTLWTTPPPGADARGIVYEIGPDGRVSHVHAGGPSIQYVEGCL